VSQFLEIAKDLIASMIFIYKPNKLLITPFIPFLHKPRARQLGTTPIP
jgi:hypothetical protein